MQRRVDLLPFVLSSGIAAYRRRVGPCAFDTALEGLLRTNGRRGANNLPHLR